LSCSTRKYGQVADVNLYELGYWKGNMEEMNFPGNSLSWLLVIGKISIKASVTDVLHFLKHASN
jgi:hypothetical protein